VFKEQRMSCQQLVEVLHGQTDRQTVLVL